MLALWGSYLCIDIRCRSMSCLLQLLQAICMQDEVTLLLVLARAKLKFDLARHRLPFEWVDTAENAETVPTSHASVWQPHRPFLPVHTVCYMLNPGARRSSEGDTTDGSRIHLAFASVFTTADPAAFSKQVGLGLSRLQITAML